MSAAYYPNNVTSDHIQQYLDENKSLILKIVESQNSGKFSECAENQAKLQRNLMYLAAIADTQPQPPIHSQQASSGIMQQGINYMNVHQPQLYSPQSLLGGRSSNVFSQQPFGALQQASLYNNYVMSSGGNSGIHMVQNEGSVVGMGESLYSSVCRDASGRTQEIASAESSMERGGNSAVLGSDVDDKYST